MVVETLVSRGFHVGAGTLALKWREVARVRVITSARRMANEIAINSDEIGHEANPTVAMLRYNLAWLLTAINPLSGFASRTK